MFVFFFFSKFENSKKIAVIKYFNPETKEISKFGRILCLYFAEC